MRTLSDRIMDHVEVDSQGCWLWQGALDRDGYSKIKLSGRCRVGHRVSYETFVGPIPEGLTLDHLCRTPRCVNPKHLDPCTTEENTRRQPQNDSTLCRNGHPRTDESTYVSPGGHRQCRVCMGA